MHYKTAKAKDASQKDQRKSLRNNMTPAVATLWRALKRRGAGGLKFRRQQGIGSYVLDFYCPDRRLCFELDGSSHDYRYEYDEARTQFLAEQGIRVVRFRNDQVFTCLSGVVEEIVKAAGEITDPTPTPPLQGRGVPTVTPPRKCRAQEGSAYGIPTKEGSGCASRCDRV